MDRQAEPADRDGGRSLESARLPTQECRNFKLFVIDLPRLRLGPPVQIQLRLLRHTPGLLRRAFSIDGMLRRKRLRRLNRRLRNLLNRLRDRLGDRTVLERLLSALSVACAPSLPAHGGLDFSRRRSFGRQLRRVRPRGRYR